jgi:hypothetical protein
LIGFDQPSEGNFVAFAGLVEPDLLLVHVSNLSRLLTELYAGGADKLHSQKTPARDRPSPAGGAGGHVASGCALAYNAVILPATARLAPVSAGHSVSCHARVINE